jgi:ubiquinone/menaquinone biosynthesis C-methylase UbiE
VTADAASLILDAIGPLEGVELLDVARGGEGAVALAAARAGATVVGVDMLPPSLTAAREIAESEGLEVDLLPGHVAYLEFEDERFDAVTADAVVSGAPRPAVAAGELFRVTTLGGRIVLVEPAEAREKVETAFAGRGVALEIREVGDGRLLVVAEKVG